MATFYVDTVTPVGTALAAAEPASLVEAAMPTPAIAAGMLP